MVFDIPVAKPTFLGNERKYVDDCMDSGWISSAGKYVEMFETAFAKFCGVKYAIACCNGTVALHLALKSLNVNAGDEVIVPTLTFVATPNAVSYCGASPVFVDSEFGSWNIDPALIEAKITSSTKGIIAVHLYGHPADMAALRDIARRHNLFLLEDAAEAHGAKQNGQIVGSLGDAAAFSFYANKIITTGEGGMVVTNDGDLAARARLLRGQGMDPQRTYWHPVIGYNYRMMNLPAAIGLAQLEMIHVLLKTRAKIAEHYQDGLKNTRGLKWQRQQPHFSHVYWMFNVMLDPAIWPERGTVMTMLAEKGIETRPIFYPCHSLPPYRAFTGEDQFPVAETISAVGISLPTWSGLSETEIDFVCDALKECVQGKARSTS